ncbi:hypothetical protein SRM_01685 [Salinibacter ruber M8]|uniref:Uncharacterized protein n=1 Tax=Salinibacter ruber (strain M8) TaxID=761659 RepID=D5H9A1_SALRM|nr:hypothetical protein SRM_01685 [Salinibacter ruber M8]
MTRDHGPVARLPVSICRLVGLLESFAKDAAVRAVLLCTQRGAQADKQVQEFDTRSDKSVEGRQSAVTIIVRAHRTAT